MHEESVSGVSTRIFFFCLKADVACLGPDDFDFHSFFFPEKNLTQAVSFDTMVFGINRLR